MEITHYEMTSFNTDSYDDDVKKYTESDKSYKFKISELVKNALYLDTSYVNGLRRYAISNINTLAFEYSNTPMNKEYINFEKNTSNMNNDFIGHRIGLLHVKIKYIKYLLLLYKIIAGHHNVLDEINKNIEKADLTEEDMEDIKKNIKSNLKLSNNSNIELIQNIIFYINVEATEEQPITTNNIQIKFDKVLGFENSSVLEKINKYTKLIEIYKTYNEINEDGLNIDKDLLTNINKYIFTKETYEDDDEYYGELLCKLKNKEILKCSFILNIGNGYKHSRWSTVCPCTYSFKVNNELVNTIIQQKLQQNNLNNIELLLNSGIDETDKEYIIAYESERYKDLVEFNVNNDKMTSLRNFKNVLSEKKFEGSIENNIIKYILDKDKLINNFNKCDKYRYFYGKDEYIYPLRIFNFSIESVGFYDSNRILYKTNKLLKQDLLNIIEKIIFLSKSDNNYPLIYEDIKIDTSDKIQKGIDIICENGNHSIGNILSSYIYYLYDSDNIEYIAYKMVHPLKTTMLITIGFTTKDNYKTKINTIFSLLKNIITKFSLNVI